MLIEPQLERFRTLHDLHGVPLTVTFEGWHRHAILTPERVFLFPRDRSRVPGLRRDAAALAGPRRAGRPRPRLLGQWEDRAVSPYPYMAVSRLPGRTWSHLERGATLEETARCWRAWGGRSRPGTASTGAPWRRRPPAPQRGGAVPGHRPAERRLGAARHLQLPQRHGQLLAARPGAPAQDGAVLVHGDVNEGQILVDEGLRVTGVLDWETAHVGHPLKDFDLGEWGYGIFAWDAHFHLLRRRMWEAYAEARGGPLPSWEAVHLAFCLNWVQWFAPRAAGDPWARARLRTTLDHLRRLA